MQKSQMTKIYKKRLKNFLEITLTIKNNDKTEILSSEYEKKSKRKIKLYFDNMALCFYFSKSTY